MPNPHFTKPRHDRPGRPQLRSHAAREPRHAGPPVLLRHLALELERAEVARDRVHIDSFGV